MKQNITRILFGITAILIAIIIFGNSFNFWNLSLNGWWTIFLIVPGISSIIKSGFTFFNTTLTLGGFILLLKKQEIIHSIPFELICAIILIFLGLNLILKPTKNYNKANIPFKENTVIINDNDISKAECTFSTLNITPEGYLAKARYNCSFGSLTVDFSKAIICDKCDMKINNAFGKVIINTYGKCRILVDGSQFLGSIIDNSMGRNNINLPTVYLRCNSSFGNVEIF